VKRKLFSFVVVFGLIGAVFCSEAIVGKKDSVTISSGYIEGLYTNDQLVNFGVELVGGIDRLENYCFGGKGLDVSDGCLLTLFVMAGGIVVNGCFSIAFHEVGHGLRGKAFGNRYSLHIKGDDEAKNFKKKENFFGYFFRRMTKPFKVGSCRRSESSVDLEVDSNGRYIYRGGDVKKSLIISCGGINNQVYFSEVLTNKFLMKGEMGAIEGFTIILNKMMPSLYSDSESNEEKKKGPWGTSNDVVRIAECYKELGIPVTKGDIQKAGLIATFLSGTTYSYIIGLYNGISNGQTPRSKPIEFFNFTAPDTYAYLTSKGVSYKMVSTYKYQEDFRIIFGVERVFSGKKTTEVTLGVNKDFPTLNASGEIIIMLGQGFNIVTNLSFPVGTTFSINGGVSSCSTGSLYGERIVRNLKGGRSNNVFVSASYWY
jgi:hypothetical protein